MSNIICYICDNNLALKSYTGKLLDEDGNKPCFECVIEAGEEESEEPEEDKEVKAE